MDESFDLFFTSYFPPNQLETPDLASLALASTFLSNSSTFFKADSLVSLA